MKKPYKINRADFFEAQSKGFIPEHGFLEVGSLWITVYMTDAEAAAYPYPKWPISY